MMKDIESKHLRDASLAVTDVLKEAREQITGLQNMGV